MTTLRSARRAPRRKFPNGQMACRHCGSACTGRRTSYCSDMCADEYAVRNFPAYARIRVLERDHGVCARCGLDTELLEKEWRRREWAIQNRLGDPPGHRRWKTLPRWADDPEWAELERQRLVYCGGQYRTRASLWDMDHVLAVAEGGGQTGLENLQTLCLPCHRAKTADMRTRLARPTVMARVQLPLMGS